jgi:hypothetical protein
MADQHAAGAGYLDVRAPERPVAGPFDAAPPPGRPAAEGDGQTQSGPGGEPAGAAPDEPAAPGTEGTTPTSP